MKTYLASEIAEICGGTILFGDGTRKVTEVSVDSREKGENLLFVPIPGERVDAHDFIGGAYESGMRVTLTSRGEIMENTGGMTYIRVEDTLAALQRLGAFVRRDMATPMIGVTGSVGKTTTKEMIAAALGAGKHVFKTAGNMNSQIGVPRMMLRLKPEHEVAVIEMGMSLFGEMERLAGVVAPDVAVMTNIGVSHIGQLGSQENIRKEKIDIIRCTRKNGLLLVNGDDCLLREIKEVPDTVLMDEKTRKRLAELTVLTYGIRKVADYTAVDIEMTEDGVSFVYRNNRTGTSCGVTLHVQGEHNILNAVAAMAVAEYHGVSLEGAAKGLSEYRPMAMRGGKEIRNGIIIIDDTYNASPDSMKGGIDILMATKAKRHIAILADMLELGNFSEQSHRFVGQYFREKAGDFLVAIGKEAKYYALYAAPVPARHFEDNEGAIAFLKEFLCEGDAVLVKGSRGMHLEEIVQAIG